MTVPQGKGRDNHTRQNIIGITSKSIINNNDKKNDNILLFRSHELPSICDRQMKIQREYLSEFNTVCIQKTLTVYFKSKAKPWLV